MNTLKNIDIAREYNVSSSTVTRWIQLNSEGKNNLKLQSKNGKFLIVDNTHNRAEIARLVDEGKKYRSNINHGKITPNDDFYNIFSESEIIEIVRDLEVYREINYKYTYKHVGAKFWDNFYKSSVRDGTYSTPSRVESLLDKSFEMIVSKIPENYKVNLIEVGPGNSLPIKAFLEKLHKIKKLNRYTVIDISPDIVEMSKSNFQSWIPDVDFRSYICDIEHTMLNNILEIERSGSENTINMVLYIGSTIGNIKDTSVVLKNIRDGLRKNDIFLLSNSTNMESNKSDFNDFHSAESVELDTWIPKLIGFETESSKLVYHYEAKSNCKTESFVLDKDYTLVVRELGLEKTIEFMKGEEIFVWRHYMTEPDTYFKELSDCNLKLVAFNTENDFSHIMMICELKK
jgi:uncharacterized SAM-dependent methyltransferase